MKNKMLSDVWSKKQYYECAEMGSNIISHPGMKMILKYSRNASVMLDMGCGEGTRLNHVVKKGQIGYGIDLSKSAVKIAKNKFNHLNFIESNLEDIPYEDSKFDFIYSAFVFEHLDNPEFVIREGLRVLKSGGCMAILCPNYGAPNRCSPPYKESRLTKLILGFMSDFSFNSKLNWQKVEPIATKSRYEIDWDTTIEPYLGSLINYVRKINLKVVDYSSCWSEESLGAGWVQKVFKFLGQNGIYPFNLWGPHLVIVVKK